MYVDLNVWTHSLLLPPLPVVIAHWPRFTLPFHIRFYFPQYDVPCVLTDESSESESASFISLPWNFERHDTTSRSYHYYKPSQPHSFEVYAYVQKCFSRASCLYYYVHAYGCVCSVHIYILFRPLVP